jgi:nucleoside-diphosphate-sugar epimerase
VARTCAVTGATGFLGRHLVCALAAEGWRIRALARRDPVAAFGSAGAEVVIGGLEPGPLAELCRGVEVLIHVAGVVKAGGAAEFAAINADGARLAAEAAKAAGARMVLVSSLAAREPQLSAYAASKRAGEAAAAAVLGSELAVVRPPAIYGPGDYETLAVFRLAAASPLLPVFDERARIALVHVEDAARQIAAAAAKPPERACVALADGRPEGYGWREIVQAAAAAVGRRPGLVGVSPGVLTLAGVAGSVAQRLGGRPMLTLGKARELRWPDWSVGPEERWPGAPPAAFTLGEGFGHTVAWWRATEGLVI